MGVQYVMLRVEGSEEEEEQELRKNGLLQEIMREVETL